MKGRGGRDDLSTAVDKVVRPVNKNFDSDLDCIPRFSAVQTFSRGIRFGTADSIEASVFLMRLHFHND